MILADIVSLAKAGYTMKDIKELLDRKEDTPIPSTEPTQPNTETGPAEYPTVDTQEEKKKEDEKGGEEKNEPDYKALYESTQKALEVAQATNVNTNIAKDIKSADELISEMFAEYM